MNKLRNAAVLAGVQCLSVLAGASALYAGGLEGSVPEGQGVVTTFGGNASAVVYWISQPDGWHVVTTIGTKADCEADNIHSIMRFSALLAPGQTQSISVPVKEDEAQPTLLISRVADRIEVVTRDRASLTDH